MDQFLDDWDFLSHDPINVIHETNVISFEEVTTLQEAVMAVSSELIRERENDILGTCSDAKKQKRPKYKDPAGFKFRKYGKKIISEEERHYYRCSFQNCDVKLHIT